MPRLIRRLAVKAGLAFARILTLLAAAGVPGLGASESAPSEKPAAGTHTVDLKAGGLDRQYLVHVPAKYDGETAVPVVLAFHGGGGHAREMITSSGWIEKSDEAGFLLVAPEGSRAKPGERRNMRRNPQTWNDGSGRFPSGRANVDDVGFVRAVLDDLAKRYAIDARRVYATGFSNGSSMTYRLGAELSGRLAAIAPVASSGLRVKVEKLAAPVPMLTIQGGADPRNPLEGGRVNGGDGIEDRPPVRKSVERWAELNGCGTKSALVSDKNGVRIERYGPGRGGAEVLFYTVEGMGHVWPGKTSVLPEFLVGKPTDKLDGTAVIWDFFRAHARPE